MPMNLEQKRAVVSQLTELAAESTCVVAADYCHLSVSDITALRKQAREKNVSARVYRNTLAKRAFSDTQFACISESLSGQLMLFFAKEEPGAAAKLVETFSKDNDNLNVKALAMDGVLLGPDQLKAVASLPTRNEALAKVAQLSLAPVTKFVRTLNEPVAQLARVIAAIRDKKQNES